MTSASPFPTFFSDPLLPPLAGGPSEDQFDSFFSSPSFAPSSSSSFAINPNSLFSHQQPSWEDQKWSEQQNWSEQIFPPSRISTFPPFATTFFDPTYDFNPSHTYPPSLPALDLSPGCTSPSSSSRSSSFDALVTPVSSTSHLFPASIFDIDENKQSSTPKSSHPQPHLSTETVVSTSSRGRKRVAPASFAEDDEDQDSSSCSFPRKLRARGKKLERDDEDEGSDFDGSEEGGSQAGHGGRRKGAKSIVDKKERRKATNRASAKAFRARRKNLLNDIQTQISERDAEIRDLQFLITRLKDEKEKILERRV